MDNILMPSRVLIEGGKILNGIIELQGDKTVAVHSLFALLFYPKTIFEITRFPLCCDTLTIINWMERNKLIQINLKNEGLSLVSDNYPDIIDIREINLIRSSICLLCPLALLNNKVIFSKIGGCNFTDRPINRHLDLAKEFGIEITDLGDYSEAQFTRSKGKIIFDCSISGLPSVGVTCHALIASLVFKGELHLTNVSIDPSVIVLINIIRSKIDIDINLLNRSITINTLHQRKIDKYNIAIPHDLTAAITYVSAVLPLKGKLIINGKLDLPETIYDLFEKLNIQFENSKGISIISSNKLLNPDFVVCRATPGIPTDCGPILSALLCNIEGSCKVIDNVYNQRNSHVFPLKEMGYDIDFEINTSYIKGKKPGNNYREMIASDIRGGAATLIGALSREASTTIQNFNEIHRGYVNIIENLQSLGAQIKSIQ